MVTPSRCPVKSLAGGLRLPQPKNDAGESVTRAQPKKEPPSRPTMLRDQRLLIRTQRLATALVRHPRIRLRPHQLLTLGRAPRDHQRALQGPGSTVPTVRPTPPPTAPPTGIPIPLRKGPDLLCTKAQDPQGQLTSPPEHEAQATSRFEHPKKNPLGPQSPNRHGTRSSPSEGARLQKMRCW